MMVLRMDQHWEHMMVSQWGCLMVPSLEQTLAQSMERKMAYVLAGMMA
jgi:hypothetical protein